MLEAKELRFSYGPDEILHGVEVAVAAGEAVALTGPSGSGKSTLLYCLAGILTATSGEVFFQGSGLSNLDQDGRTRLRREHFGFVFQFAEMVPELTLRENVELPLRLNGRPRKDAGQRAREVLDRLGIAQVADHLPSQVSGGQAQRAAVARAVVHRPAVVFADEPTGSLDSGSGAAVLEELRALTREDGSSLVLVTHDPSVAATMDRAVRLSDGICTR
jgi:putative ABC transport system ATP-binding protein